MENIAHISKDISQYRQKSKPEPTGYSLRAGLFVLLNNTLTSTTNIITVKQDSRCQLLDTVIKENKCHLHTTPSKS